MSNKYQKWVDWNKEHNKQVPPMTNTQARFAEKMLNDKELEVMLAQPGDINIIFKSLQYYLKNRIEEKKNQIYEKA